MTRAVVCLLLLLPGLAEAQTKRIEIAFGAALDGSASAGSTRTELLDSGGNPVTLFDASHRRSAGIGIDVGVAYRLRPRVVLELSGAWTRPDLKTTITNDFEEVAPTTVSLGIHRFSTAGAVVRDFGRRGALEPYLRAGAGWFRELTADRALVDDGVQGHVGGGVKYWLGNMALRADVRLVFGHGGLTFGDTATRWSPAATVSLIIAR